MGNARARVRPFEAALDPYLELRLSSEGRTCGINGAIVGTVEGRTEADRLAERFCCAEQVRGALVLTSARHDLCQRLDAAREKPFLTQASEAVQALLEQPASGAVVSLAMRNDREIPERQCDRPCVAGLAPSGGALFKRGAGVVVFLECEEYNTVACERDRETKGVRRCAGQPDRLLSQRPAGRRMTLGKAHHCQKMQCVGRCGHLFDHSSDRCAFLQARASRSKITLCPRQDAISQQGACAGPCSTGRVVNRRAEKCASLTPMPTMEPEPEQSGRQS